MWHKPVTSTGTGLAPRAEDCPARIRKAVGEGGPDKSLLGAFLGSFYSYIGQVSSLFLSFEMRMSVLLLKTRCLRDGQKLQVSVLTNGLMLYFTNGLVSIGMVRMSLPSVLLVFWAPTHLPAMLLLNRKALATVDATLLSLGLWANRFSCFHSPSLRCSVPAADSTPRHIDRPVVSQRRSRLDRDDWVQLKR